VIRQTPDRKSIACRLVISSLSTVALIGGLVAASAPASAQSAQSISGPLYGSLPGITVDGIPSGGAPWVVDGQVSLASGRLSVSGSGLLVAPGDTASGAHVAAKLVGTTGGLTAVSIEVRDASGGSYITSPTPLSTSGSFSISAPVQLPAPMTDPIVLVGIAGTGTALKTWIASSDFLADFGHSVPGTPPATNLIINGGFEQPNVGSDYKLFSTGQHFDGWTVVGATGNVAPISGAYTQNGFTFDSQSGKQWLDLTGLSNTATGVNQTVATTQGARYNLTFWVGNVVDPGGIFGTSSTVEVYVDGRRLETAVNAKGAGSKVQVWQEFNATFAAESARTSMEFINGDPSSDNSDGLDSVSLSRLR
jgi:Protein of unknown function (DUF642)